MRESFECPACGVGSGTWESVATDRFLRNRAPADAYHALRHQVLFEVWFPGADAIILTTVMCRSCGFMTYAPRPSAADIDAKYRMLQTRERHIGAHADDPLLIRRDRERARRVFRTVMRYAPEGPLDVLDFGGGDGKMLVPFAEAGHRCALIDYNVEPRKGVRKLGDTLADLDPDARFDVITCSHVIEHLADPDEHVARFARHLRPGGIVYGEVPLGIWRGIGITRDPVTHINFFTRYAFGRLFERRGLSVLTLRHGVGCYTRRLDVIVAVSTSAALDAPALENDGVEEARALLRPSLAMDVRRHIRLHRMPAVGSLVRRIASRHN